MFSDKPFFKTGLGLLALTSILTLTQAQTAHSQSLRQAQSTPATLATIMARLSADEAKTTIQDRKIAALQSTVKSQAATIQNLRQTNTLNAHTAQASPNVTTTTYGPFTVTGNEVYLSGYNLHIQNGGGKTNSTNGLGNLIVGYNETKSGNIHTGSHNLIVGQFHTYSSYGGLVAGYSNSITGVYASVAGGNGNTAGGQCAAVSGGFGNKATGSYSSVVGGQSYTASAQYALEPVATSIASLQTQITNQNKITSLFTLSNGVGTNTEMTLTGKNLHIINGQGLTETQNGLGNLIVGYNETRGSGDTRTGSHNIVTGQYNNFSSSGGIIGGYFNSLSGLEGFVTGYGSQVSGDRAANVGGYNNMVSGNFACIVGGSGNVANGSTSTVSGGNSNAAYGGGSSVSGGTDLSVSAQYGWAAGSQASGGTTNGNFTSQ